MSFGIPPTSSVFWYGGSRHYSAEGLRWIEWLKSAKRLTTHKRLMRPSTACGIFGFSTQPNNPRRALELINKHLDQPITLQFIAKQVGLSSHYLSRLFHAETGKPFNQYVIEAKMQRAAKLLRESTMKVYEVSDSIGIPNYRYFAALFKKHWGMTPIDYRKNVMK